MQVNDKTFELYIAEKEIEESIRKIAQKINEDYQGKEVLFIGVLNGVFMFAGELMKYIDLPCEITFIKVQSYDGMSSSGKVHELIGLTTDIKGKDVIVLEDIVDTGITLGKLNSIISSQSPNSFEIATLLYKPDAFKGEFPPKYVGFSIENKFIVGYGMDYQQKGRNLKDIYKLKE